MIKHSPEFQGRINEIETKYSGNKIGEMESWFFKKITRLINP